MKGPGTHCFHMHWICTLREKSMIGQWGGPALFSACQKQCVPGPYLDKAWVRGWGGGEGRKQPIAQRPRIPSLHCLHRDITGLGHWEGPN